MTESAKLVSDAFMHQMWTKIVPVAVLAPIAAFLFRKGVERLTVAVVRIFRGTKSAAGAGAREEDATLDAPPACPDCRRPMAKRTAKRGENRGAKFWGCTAFPTCRGTRAIVR